MSLEAVAFLAWVGWMVVMWRLQGLSTDMKILRAEAHKGGRLTLEEEESAAHDEPIHRLDKKA